MHAAHVWPPPIHVTSHTHMQRVFGPMKLRWADPELHTKIKEEVTKRVNDNRVVSGGVWTCSMPYDACDACDAWMYDVSVPCMIDAC